MARTGGPFGRLVPVAAFLIAGYAFIAFNLGVAFAIPGFIFLIGGGVGFLFTPLGKALTRSVEVEAGIAHGDIPQELLVELDDLRARVAELEERQDFSERMLAKGPGSERHQ
ncbi:MAG: hypothetical protein ACHQXA_02955 [Gemmatimonadales bacterium]